MPPLLLLLSTLSTGPVLAGPARPTPTPEASRAVSPSLAGPAPLYAEGHAEHVPEPMRFDLVRGLHARAGEIEANVLVQGALSERSFEGIAWAPEVEWAFADGAAIELEVPMHDDTVQALKVAAQARLAVTGPVTHGVQVIGELGVGHPSADLYGLHVAAVKLPARFSLLWIGGVRAARADADTRLGLTANTTVFRRIGQAGVLGVETNLKVLDGKLRTTVLPQVHLPFADVFMLQAGLGVDLSEGRANPRGGVRVILQRRTRSVPRVGRATIATHGEQHAAP